MTRQGEPANEPADASGQEGSIAEIILAAYYRDSPEAAQRLADEVGLTIPRDPGVTGGEQPSAAG